MKKFFKLCSFSVLGTLTASCFLFSGCKAAEAEPAGFISKPEMMKTYDFIPFQRAWKDKNVRIRDYNKIMVVPIFTEHHQELSGLEKTNIRRMIGKDEQDLMEFAEYTQNAFKKAIKEDKRLQLATKPGPDTMILEIAFVKVVAGKPILGGFSNLTNLTPIGFILMPLKVGVKASTDSPMQASVAIEGKFRDSLTKKVIATFADREKQKVAIFNFKDFTSYGNNRQIVDEWAKQLVQVLNMDPEKGEKVENSKPFKAFNY